MASHWAFLRWLHVRTTQRTLKKKKYRCLGLAHRDSGSVTLGWGLSSACSEQADLRSFGPFWPLWPPPPALAHSLTQPLRWYHSSGWERKEMAPLAGDPDGRVLSLTPAPPPTVQGQAPPKLEAFPGLWRQNTFNWRADPRGGRVWKEFEMMKMFCGKTAVMVAQPCEYTKNPELYTLKGKFYGLLLISEFF